MLGDFRRGRAAYPPARLISRQIDAFTEAQIHQKMFARGIAVMHGDEIGKAWPLCITA